MMPAKELLPAALAGVATRQAFELSDRRWPTVGTLACRTTSDGKLRTIIWAASSGLITGQIAHTDWTTLYSWWTSHAPSIPVP
jgi:hypothetical protein